MSILETIDSPIIVKVHVNVTLMSLKRKSDILIGFSPGVVRLMALYKPTQDSDSLLSN
jgi:hypothetical protein